MRGWGAEEIFRPIAFAWLEWIRRLGPYVILEEHGPGIYNIHINTIKRLGPYVILDEHGPGIYHFLPAIGRHFVRDRHQRHLRVFPASVTFSKNKCNALNVSWQVVGNGPRIGVDSGTQSSCERDLGGEGKGKQLLHHLTMTLV